jgi:hypothetical protein
MMLVAGALGMAINGCGNSDDGTGKTGGTTGSGSSAASSATGSGGSSAAESSSAVGGSSAPASSSSSAAGGSGGTSAESSANGGRSSTGTGGAGTGGKATTGGTSTKTGGTTGEGTGGAKAGTTATGGTAAGGTAKGGSVAGGTTGAGGTGAGGRTGTSTASGTCTASKAAGVTVSGTGKHKVTVETNSDAGINKGTIYRPTDLGGAEKYPIFVWGEGACTADGTSNQAAMGEIASQGYFVIADGLPKGSGSSPQDGSTLLGYITWAIAENDKPCSAYYQSLDTTKIASDGFSCGGLMSENASKDPRLTAVGITSSGLFNADQNVYKGIHTPIKILVGGSGDMAYENGKRDYEQIAALGKPVIYFSKDGAGHGGDLGRGTGDFNTVNLAWLNWQLKGDTGATGKALLMGDSCKYCKASGWEFGVKNIQ